jgi:hypothetical protein
MLGVRQSMGMSRKVEGVSERRRASGRWDKVGNVLAATDSLRDREYGGHRGVAPALVYNPAHAEVIDPVQPRRGAARRNSRRRGHGRKRAANGASSIGWALKASKVAMAATARRTRGLRPL